MFRVLLVVWCLHQVSSVCVEGGMCMEKKFVQEIVDVHNSFRRAVTPQATNMVMMEYNEELGRTAQAWVDNCILAHGDPTTRMFEGYELGENLFYTRASPVSWTDVITAWHDEEENYTYPKGSKNRKAIGHYTQVVWYSSYQVGCAVKLCPKSTYLYGCHYYRAGNVRGFPPYNDGESGADCQSEPVDGLCSPADICEDVDAYLSCPARKMELGCDHEWVKKHCPASCNCPDKIISIL